MRRHLVSVDNGIIKPMAPIDPADQDDNMTIIKTIGAAELLEMDIPPMRWVADKVLPVGVIHFAGKEKLFKSFFALGMCLAFSGGQPYLDFQPVGDFESLYIDLESTERRPRDRIRSMEEAIQATDKCHILTANNLCDREGGPLTLDNNFTDALARILEDNRRIRLVVVDVFRKIRSRRQRNEDDYSWDYRDVGKLKEVADQYDVAIILISHVVKGEIYQDDFDNARGAGINAAADCLWILSKNKNAERSATLKIKGRDVEPQEFEITFNTDTFCWERVEPTESALKKDYRRSNIPETLEVITQFASWTGLASELITVSCQAGTPIAVDAKQLGMDLNRFEALLREDGYTFVRKTVRKGVQYTFTNNK